MKRFSLQQGAAWLSAIAGLALLVSGCAEGTTQKDVAQAQRDLRQEQQDVREAAREGQQEVSEAQREAHTVNRPVIEDRDVANANRNVMEAQREARENVAGEQRDVAQAAATLDKKQRELAATQARDTFAKDAQARLDLAEKQIEQLETRASSLQGAEKDALNEHIKALKVRHDTAEDALGDLKGADLDKWQVHQATFQAAMQDLTRDLNANR